MGAVIDCIAKSQHSLKLQTTSSKMPFVKVATNLARNQLPKSFMPRFNKQLAVILNKDEKVFKWQLETDKYMAVGCGEDDHRKPYMLIEIESFGVFNTTENCHKFMPQIFKAAMAESGVAEEAIVAKFRDLNPSHVGVMSKCVK